MGIIHFRNRAHADICLGLVLSFLALTCYAETKKIELRLVLEGHEIDILSYDVHEYLPYEKRSPKEIAVAKDTFLANADIEEIVVTRKKNTRMRLGPLLTLIFKPESAVKLEDITEKYPDREIAVVMGGKVLAVLAITERIVKGRLRVFGPLLKTDEEAASIVEELGFEPIFIEDVTEKPLY